MTTVRALLAEREGIRTTLDRITVRIESAAVNTTWCPACAMEPGRLCRTQGTGSRSGTPMAHPHRERVTHPYTLDTEA